MQLDFFVSGVSSCMGKKHKNVATCGTLRTEWIDRCALFPHPSRQQTEDHRFRREASLLEDLDRTFPELGLYHQGHMSLLEPLGREQLPGDGNWMEMRTFGLVAIARC